jgi:hypothetical protein
MEHMLTFIMLFLHPLVALANEPDGALKFMTGSHGLLNGINRRSLSESMDCSHLFKKGSLVADQRGGASKKAETDTICVLNSEGLHEALGIKGSVDLNLAFGGVSGSGGHEQSSGLSSETLTLVVRAVQIFATERYEDCHFDLEKISKFTDDELVELCGEEIIMKQQRTAELYVMISFNQTSRADHHRTFGSASVKVCGIGGGSGEFNVSSENLSNKKQVHIHCESIGLGDLSSFKESVKAALSCNTQSLASIEGVVQEHLNNCSLEKGVPSRFFTQNTQKLIALVRGGRIVN